MPEPTRTEALLAKMSEHRGIAYRIAMAYTKTSADRDDLAQEISFQVWRSLDRYDEQYKFSTWMYRVALNVAISFYRRESRWTYRTVLSGDSILEVAKAVPETTARADDLRILRQLVGRLDPLERALVVLYLDGNTHHTIAEVLGISESNVGTKVNRIKKRLRRDFDDERKKESTDGT